MWFFLGNQFACHSHIIFTSTRLSEDLIFLRAHIYLKTGGMHVLDWYFVSCFMPGFIRRDKSKIWEGSCESCGHGSLNKLIILNSLLWVFFSDNTTFNTTFNSRMIMLLMMIFTRRSWRKKQLHFSWWQRKGYVIWNLSRLVFYLR